MKVENLLKRLCYKQQGNTWYKTIGYSLVLVKIEGDYIHMSQVFKSKKDNDIAIWAREKQLLQETTTISDLIALEVTTCRGISFFEASEEGLNIFIPQLTLLDLIEL